MIFDSDILIWYFRKNEAAAELLNQTSSRALSVQNYMEVLQGTRSLREQSIIRETLKRAGFKILPLSESIGHRAAVYVEEYALSHGLRSADAIIAATAIEYGEILSTGNAKHFQCIPGLRLQPFRV